MPEFNSRTQAVSTTTRAGQTTANRAETTAGTATEDPAAPAATAYQWSRYAPAGTEGYECSTQGDRRFSAITARLENGRTIEEAYQLDVKGYRVQGNDWRLGKGKPPLQPMTPQESYEQYKALWRQWATENPVLIDELATAANGIVLTDKFASTPISQAWVLAELLNERQLASAKSSDAPTASPDRITSLTANQVFVFGSNTQGRHGKGAALQAMQFGAEYGNPRGRQGQTYAIVTKDLTKPKDQQHRSVPLNDIEQQISKFLAHAIAHPQNGFLVTRFGCDLAGYSEPEIGSLWIGKDVPTNVRLPQAFLDVMEAALESPAIVPEKQTTESAKPLPAATLVVIAGGQTGGDMGGLKAGKALGLETGGTAPHGWLVERCARFPNGTNPGLADYGLVEGPRGASIGHTYLLRTELNVQNSHGTLVLGSIDPVKDKGSFHTIELAETHGKPCLHISTTDLFKHPNESVLRIKDWVLAEGIGTLNVAGNRESKCPELEDRVETVLKVALAEVVRVKTAIVSLPEQTPEPARYLIYADRESCPQSGATDVQTQTCNFTQKAIQEAHKRGYARMEIIVATLNEDPANLECLQPLIAAAQAGVSKTRLMSEASDKPPFQAEVYESSNALVDLLDLKGNPDSRLILISNGQGEGTKQMVQQAELLSVKVIGYNPEKQEYIGASQPQPVPMPTRTAKGSRGNER